MLIDSFYRRDENYHPKVFLEKYCFIEDIEIYCSNSDEEYYEEECMIFFQEHIENKNSFSLELKRSIFRNIRNFLSEVFFHFSSTESYFLKYKKAPFLEILKTKIGGFPCPKYKKFFWCFYFMNYKKISWGRVFFIFSSLD